MTFLSFDSLLSTSPLNFSPLWVCVCECECVGANGNWPPTTAEGSDEGGDVGFDLNLVWKGRFTQVHAGTKQTNKKIGRKEQANKQAVR